MFNLGYNLIRMLLRFFFKSFFGVKDEKLNCNYRFRYVDFGFVFVMGMNCGSICIYVCDLLLSKFN